MANLDRTINYVEFPLTDNEGTKRFFSDTFGWSFQDWGPDYMSFTGAGLEGGFNRESAVPVTAPGILVVLFADDLEETEQRIEKNGGTIVKPIYGFPGGRRFHFLDPNGNELAVWSDT